MPLQYLGISIRRLEATEPSINVTSFSISIYVRCFVQNTLPTHSGLQQARTMTRVGLSVDPAMTPITAAGDTLAAGAMEGHQLLHE